MDHIGVAMTTHRVLNQRRKTGSERLQGTGVRGKPTILEFWRWGFSDVLSNTMRSVLAEFIVANALGAKNGVRDPWIEYDIMTLDGIKIEVKSAAYLQSWPQNKPSPISFSIAKARRWAFKPTRLIGRLRRHSDIYVFCLLAHTDRETINPLNVDQWEFFILRTNVINKLGDQKSISLKKLLKLKPIRTSFVGLGSEIRALIG
jgi:hypothetical protein